MEENDAGDGEMPGKEEVAGRNVAGAEGGIGAPGDEGAVSGERPDFRVVQIEHDKEGKTIYKDVGALWRKTSKAGNEFYTLKIGKLRLLVFPNDREKKDR
jgi:hypothetical protein